MTAQKRTGFLMIVLGPIGAYVALFSWEKASVLGSLHVMILGAIIFAGTKE